MTTVETFPAYSYVPGGPWPHPTGSPEGHSFGHRPESVPPIVGGDWAGSAAYLRGFVLYNEGYYWEAHESWESLWHAHGRKGPTADLLRGLIKLAAAGVKVREGQSHGVSIHAGRAADLFEKLAESEGRFFLGLDLVELADVARGAAESPTEDTAGKGTPVRRVFTFRVEPR